MQFIPNGTLACSPVRQLAPLAARANMGGTSTYMRQVALIELMAHLAPSFREIARLGPIDNLHARGRPSDDSRAGVSTSPLSPSADRSPDASNGVGGDGCMGCGRHSPSATRPYS